MQGTLKKSIVLSSTLALCLSTMLLVGATKPSGMPNNMLFGVTDILGREDETIQVEVSLNLIRDSRIERDGRQYSVQAWSSFLVKNLLFGRCADKIKRVEFRSETPSIFERSCSSGDDIRNAVSVCLTDGGTTAVVVCNSIDVLSGDRLRACALSLFF